MSKFVYIQIENKPDFQIGTYVNTDHITHFGMVQGTCLITLSNGLVIESHCETTETLIEKLPANITGDG